MDEMMEETGAENPLAGPDPMSVASKQWLDMIKDAETYFHVYNEKCDSIDKLYADLSALSGEGKTDRQFQIFWANLEVLKPSIYSRPPVPVVTSRFKDRKELSRHASEILERSLITSYDTEDINATMLLARDDLATCARGVIWPRYEAYDTGERICYDHVDRKDFLHDPARKWKEVDWVARRAWKTREEMRKRFERNSGALYLEAEYRARRTDNEEKATEGEEKCAVWELWCKSKNVVVWVSPGVDEVLDQSDPFLSLEGFFPCPRPAYGTVQRGSLIPVPDFLQYKDQVEEINELTARISALSEALRMKGFYAGGAEDIGDAIETAMKSVDNEAILIPVPNVGALGGQKLADAVVWLPVVEVANTVAALVELRKQLIQDVYEITGISDIMRGSTDATETLGAQQLKSQYGSVRVRDRQEELVRIARDVTRLAGEIMAENFAPETLMAMSQYDAIPPQAQPQPMQDGQPQQPQVTWEAVMQLLRDQRMRPFTLEIETDSTIMPDENAAKQRVSEFLTAVGGVLPQLGAMVQSQPASAPFAGELLKFSLSPFRAGREMEAAVDDFVEKMKGAAQQAAQQPNPEAMKAEMEAKAKEAEIGIKREELDLKKQESAAKLQLERDKLVASGTIERMKMVAGQEEGDVNGMVQAEMQQAAEILAELKASGERQTQMMQLFMQIMLAPKRIIRDETGAPVSVEPVMPSGAVN